ncbi:TPA: hypothetical protein DD394_05435 [bacterium UBP9_UBA11836]|nr:hypothetical protein [bacterium UBP9_UBA11836]
MTFVGPINYILKSADAFKKLFILIVFSIFVITSPAVAGYCIKSIRAIRDGSDELPNLEFGDFVELFVDGLRLSLQMIFLLLPSLIVTVLLLVAMISGKEGAFFCVLATMMAVGLLNTLVLIYYATAVTCLSAEDDGWLLAFKFSELNRLIAARRNDYFKAIVFSVGWSFIFSIAGSFLPIIGSFIVTPFTTAAQAYFSGMYMREIRGGQPVAQVGNVYDASAGSSEDIDSAHDHSRDLGDNSDY